MKGRPIIFKMDFLHKLTKESTAILCKSCEQHKRILHRCFLAYLTKYAFINEQHRTHYKVVNSTHKLSTRKSVLELSKTNKKDQGGRALSFMQHPHNKRQFAFGRNRPVQGSKQPHPNKKGTPFINNVWSGGGPLYIVQERRRSGKKSNTKGTNQKTQTLQPAGW